MPHEPTTSCRSRAARSVVKAGSMLILSMAIVAPAEARGGHGFGSHGFHHGFGGHGMHQTDGGGSFTRDHRRGDDAYVKAASEEEDKLLNTRIKSICRGC